MFEVIISTVKTGRVERKGFDSRWTDYLPTPGKRSGAYSTGVYGVHPY